MKVAQLNKYLRVLYVNDNNNNFKEYHETIIFEGEKVLFEGGRYLLDNLVSYDKPLVLDDIDVMNRRTVTTGFKNNDKAFITKMKDGYLGDPQYALYLNNDYFNFKLENIKEYGFDQFDTMYKEYYYSDKLDFRVDIVKHFENMESLKEKEGSINERLRAYEYKNLSSRKENKEIENLGLELIKISKELQVLALDFKFTKSNELARIKKLLMIS